MARAARPWVGDERGDTFIVTLLAVVILLAVVFMGANLIVDQYGQGVVRTAVDEGAQTGSVQGDPASAVAACQAKEAEVMSGLLSGGLGRDLHLNCQVQGPEVVAVATGTLPGWLPPVPAVHVQEVGVQTLETPPGPTTP
ncbi:MAG TPA: hypothetical protein VMU63_03955 [Acidimicrobiales bacterium]|nr:hypothetical protein [Acidimicrobiales bacterium]